VWLRSLDRGVGRWCGPAATATRSARGTAAASAGIACSRSTAARGTRTDGRARGASGATGRTVSCAGLRATRAVAAEAQALPDPVASLICRTSRGRGRDGHTDHQYDRDDEDAKSPVAYPHAASLAEISKPGGSNPDRQG